MSSNGLADSTGHSEQPGPLTVTAEEQQDQGQQQAVDTADKAANDVSGSSEPANDAPVAHEDQGEASKSSQGLADGDSATAATESKQAEEASTTAEQATNGTSQESSSPPESQPAASESTGGDANALPSVSTLPSFSETTDANSHQEGSTATSASANPPTPSIETDKSTSSTLEAAPLTPTTSNAGSSSTAPASSSTKTAAPPKKFTSSLSMNKKFLEKAGATDSKSPQPANATIPKAGTSPATRSPALASPGIPAHPGTSASPPITLATSAPTSHPRLLTGKLSTLASGSGSGSTPPPASATWGRPGLATGAPTGSAFGKGGFVPAAPVGGAGPPGSAGPRLGGPPGPHQALGRMRGAFGQQSRAGHAPWAGAGRNNAGFSRGGSLDQDFPSFQEAARAEEQRQHALLAKERAEKMAAAAQAAYNQRVLEGLKGFSGEYTSSTTHWDEIDDDDDDLGDVLEFADGTRYEVPHSESLPTEAEAAAFQQAAQAEKEAAALHAEYRESLAREQSNGEASSDVPEPVDKSERFVDDFDRGERKKAQAEAAANASASASAGRQPASGRTLYNERLGRFEPYAGRAPPQGKKERKTSPPAVLQRPSKATPTPQEQTRQPAQRLPSGQQPLGAGKAVKTPLSPATITKGQAPAENKDAPPRKVESPWAKLPPVAQQPIPTEAEAAQAKASAAASSTTPASASAATTLMQAQPATPATVATPATPAAPAEDPEEAYKREMRSIAEQARKRRQEEEAEREAQKERARKKAQELEEKMKALQPKEATLAPTPTSAKPTPTTILSPPAAKSDRQANWRKPSVDHTAPQELPKQPVQQPDPDRQGPRMAAPTSIKSPPVRPTPTERKSEPAPNAAEAPNSKANASWRKQEAPPSQAEVQKEPIVQKRDTVSPSNQVATVQKQQQAQPSARRESEDPASPPTSAPRVRLGRRAPSTNGEESNTTGVPHAFPQPTILVGRSARQPDAHAGQQQPVSALDKIMSQVRAAQDDLKTRQAAAAMLEEERRKMQGSSKDDFDGALDRISKALSQASVRPKGREKVPSPIMMNPPVVEETFETTIPDRPQSPRIWKTFNVKIPSVMRSEVRDLPAYRIRAFEDPYFPPPIFSSSWIPPKGVRLPRHTTLEEYLFPNEDPSAPPRVKVSKLYLAAAAPAEEAPVASTSKTIPPPDMSSRAASQALQNGATDKASLDSDAFVRTAPVSLDEEEDIATVPFEDDDEEIPSVIKVSLPKPVLAPVPEAPQSSSATAQASASAIGTGTEGGRFKTYGPRLPENSTVAFRRGISPSKALESNELSQSNIFMVNSEINGTKDDSLPSFMRSYDQQVVDEVSAPSKAFAAISSAPRNDPKPSPPVEPVFPSLSPADRKADAETGSQSSFSGMRREELPRHVIAELERLNATVSATPLTNPPRLDSPASLLAGRSTSPWAVGTKASMVPSALSLSAIDPSMSLWSKPTEETAAAAAAAFNSASKEHANDSVQENSLKDLVDDYPSSMPSNAMDLPISDSERPQSKDSSSHGQHRSPPPGSGHRARSNDRRGHAMSISQVISSSSPIPPSMPLTGRSARDHPSSARQGSFNFSPVTTAQGYAVEGSPYGMPAQLPYSAHQAVYSPAMPQQYSAYGSAYTTGYPASNGMTLAYPASPYVTLSSQDARSVSAQSYGGGSSVWVPGSAMSGMNGSFTSGAGAAISPYGSSASGGVSSSAQGYPSSGKARMHSSPLYGGNQRSSPIGGDHHHQQQPHGAGSYVSYGYPGSGPSTGVPSLSPRHHYSSFSPQLTSPSAGGGGGAGSGGYAASQGAPNGSMNHLRSASAQQYGSRRQGW